MALFAGAYGYLDEWPVPAVAEYEKQMLEFMDSKYPHLLKEIKEKQDISEKLEDNLKKALDEFKGVFHTAV
jgi:F-type H+-transporting ATPase subunit alpha